jgi:hypothetical protein
MCDAPTRRPPSAFVAPQILAPLVSTMCDAPTHLSLKSRP